MKEDLESLLKKLGYSSGEVSEIDSSLRRRRKLPEFVKENIGFTIESRVKPDGYYPTIPRMYDKLSDLLKDPVYLCKETLTCLEEEDYDLSLYRYTTNVPAYEIIAGILLSTTEKRLSEGKFSLRKARPKPSFL